MIKQGSLFILNANDFPHDLVDVGKALVDLKTNTLQREFMSSVKQKPGYFYPQFRNWLERTGRVEWRDLSYMIANSVGGLSIEQG